MRVRSLFYILYSGAGLTQPAAFPAMQPRHSARCCNKTINEALLNYRLCMHTMRVQVQCKMIAHGIRRKKRGRGDTLRGSTIGCKWPVYLSSASTCASALQQTGLVGYPRKLYELFLIFSPFFFHTYCTDRWLTDSGRCAVAAAAAAVLQVAVSIAFDGFSARVLFHLPGSGQHHHRRQSQNLNLRTGAAAMSWSAGEPTTASWNEHHELLSSIVDAHSPPGEESELRRVFDVFDEGFTSWLKQHRDDAKQVNSPGGGVPLPKRLAEKLSDVVRCIRILGIDPGVAEAVRSRRCCIMLRMFSLTMSLQFLSSSSFLLAVSQLLLMCHF